MNDTHFVFETDKEYFRFERKLSNIESFFKLAEEILPYYEAINNFKEKFPVKKKYFYFEGETYNGNHSILQVDDFQTWEDSETGETICSAVCSSPRGVYHPMHIYEKDFHLVREVSHIDVAELLIDPNERMRIVGKEIFEEVKGEENGV